ncbi:MAG: hypothetical protein KH546_11445 [Clostridiales bacterium]|nr:hypothetical protein [Clostridiales bacterium]
MLKNINWKVRLKNPTFWIQLVIALVSPILVGLGVQWQDMTTWAALWDALCNAVSNPVRRRIARPIEQFIVSHL